MLTLLLHPIVDCSKYDVVKVCIQVRCYNDTLMILSFCLKSHFVSIHTIQMYKSALEAVTIEEKKAVCLLCICYIAMTTTLCMQGKRNVAFKKMQA